MNGPRIEIWSLDRIKPYEKNPRTIPDRAIAKVAGSLKQFGFQKPIVVDEAGTIVAGHVLFKAAISAGIERVPVAISALAPELAKAYRLADNRSAQETDWIDDLLKDELVELKSLDVDLGATGFDDRELMRLLADDTAKGEETPPVPDDPVTIIGDVWLLGNHRLVCGDSTKADDVARCLGPVRPHLMVTDPPYGVEYDPEWRNKALGANGHPFGGRAIGKVVNDDRADWADAYALFPGDVAYVWHPAGARQVAFYNSLVVAGFEIRMQIVWAKNVAPIGRGNFHVQHEPCWYAVRKRSGATAHWQGARDQTTVWRIDKPQKSETGHSTQKPIECMRRPIVNNSSPGQAIYEPFSGSGTTIIAAEMTGRICHAIEINPAYVDVAVLRWQQFTGGVATHETDGRTFLEYAAERQPMRSVGVNAFKDDGTKQPA